MEEKIIEILSVLQKQIKHMYNSSDGIEGDDFMNDSIADMDDKVESLQKLIEQLNN